MRLLRPLGLVLVALLAAEAAVRILEATGALSPQVVAGAGNLVLAPGIIAHPHLVCARDPGARPVLPSFCRGNVSLPDRTTHPRIAILGAAPGKGDLSPDVTSILLETVANLEVLDCRTPGWTSAEALAHYCLVVQDYAPDVVVVDPGCEDLRPRALPGYVSSYAHFRRIISSENGSPEGWLSCSRLAMRLMPPSELPSLPPLRDLVEVDVPGVEARLSSPEPLPSFTTGAFHRNLVTLAELVLAAGGIPVLVADAPGAQTSAPKTALWTGLAEHATLVRQACQETGALLLDLDSLLPGRPAPDDPFSPDTEAARAHERTLAGGILALDVFP